MQDGAWDGFVIEVGDDDSSPSVLIKKCFSCRERERDVMTRNHDYTILSYFLIKFETMENSYAF